MVGTRPSVRIAAVGDVVAPHDGCDDGLALVDGVLGEFDLVIAQNERLYSDRPDIGPSPVGFTELCATANVAALRRGHFDVVSFASNHCLDLGPDVFADTIAALRSAGYAVVGAGDDLAEARRPAIVERGGVRVGVLSYCSVLRAGYEATATRPGAAPMRAHTLYEQVDHQPGTEPRIRTFPDTGDLAGLVDDVARLRDRCDVVVVSLHWGLHFVRALLADYQREVAVAAIDAGADAIVGHHPHVVKAVDFHRGKPIFHSLGNFCFDSPRRFIEAAGEENEEFDRLLERYAGRWVPEYDDRYAVYAWAADSIYSMIARFDVGADGVRASLRPVLIDHRARPRPLVPGDPCWDEVYGYIVDVTSSQGIATRFEPADDGWVGVSAGSGAAGSAVG